MIINDLNRNGSRPLTQFSFATSGLLPPSNYLDVNADSFWVLRPENGQMKSLTLRVPYPLGFHSRHAAGRIDATVYLAQGLLKGRGRGPTRIHQPPIGQSIYTQAPDWHTQPLY